MRQQLLYRLFPSRPPSNLAASFPHSLPFLRLSAPVTRSRRVAWSPPCAAHMRSVPPTAAGSSSVTAQQYLHDHSSPKWPHTVSRLPTPCFAFFSFLLPFHLPIGSPFTSLLAWLSHFFLSFQRITFIFVSQIPVAPPVLYIYIAITFPFRACAFSIFSSTSVKKS